MNPKTITRLELYDKVWELPMSRLAKTYGLSDVGLAKICRKHDIPRPPRGYWAQIEVGKAPARTPLPHADKNCSIELRDRSDGYLTSSALNEGEQPAIEDSQQVARIIVPEMLRGCHQLVSRANQELQGAKLDQEGLIAIENPVLDIRQTTEERST